MQPSDGYSPLPCATSSGEGPGPGGEGTGPEPVGFDWVGLVSAGTLSAWVGVGSPASLSSVSLARKMAAPIIATKEAIDTTLSKRLCRPGKSGFERGIPIDTTSAKTMNARPTISSPILLVVES